MRGALEDYRAAKEDVRQDREDQHVKIACPTLALWGEEFASGGKMWDFPAIWSEMADDIRTEPIAKCGHLPHEERPDEVSAILLDSLSGWKS